MSATSLAIGLSRGDVGEADVDQALDVARYESLGFHRRPQLGRVDGRAVMADARRLFRECGGERGIARRDDRPAVDEDLRADLLCDRLPVDRDRSAGRRRNPAFQVEPGGMLGGVAVAAPPQDRAVLDDVIEPRLADLARRDVRRARRDPRARG